MTPLQPTRLEWLRKFVRQNPLLLGWNGVLICGGLLLLIYHAGLGYLPDFGTGELAGLMASVTLAGLLFISTFVFLSFLPGIALRWLESSWPLISYKRYFDERETFILWGLPIVLWAPYLFFGAALQKFSPFFFSEYVFLGLIVAVSFATALSVRRRTSSTSWAGFWKGRILSRHTVAFSVWTTLFIFPLYIGTNLAATGESDRGTATLVAAVVFLTLFNGIFYVVQRKDLGYGLLFGAFLVTVLIPIISGQSLLLAQGVMQTLSLGHKNAATLTISGKNCHSLSRFGIQCMPEDFNKSVIELENVNVLSRVGTTVLIELLVKQTPNGLSESISSKSRSGTFVIEPKHRRLYCPSSDSIHSAQCDACDSLLVQRSTKVMESGRSHTTYPDELICVQFTIPKSEILNMSFASKRKYSGYTSFSLPVQREISSVGDANDSE